MRTGSSKVHSVDEVAMRLSAMPEERKGLVLANGIFDLIHVGHIRYLTAAREAGRSLLVAVNSDASARKLKGADRPVLPLEERLEIVASLECVDGVVPFEGDTVEELLRRLRPEIHAKGTDYTVESVPERGVAQELGIRTVIVGDVKRHASSSLIGKIRGGGGAGG